MHVAVGDVRLFFDVSGEKLVPNGAEMREKPTVLLLHGGPGFDHSMLKPWFVELADAAQLIYVEHRGNGRSDRSTADKLNLAQWGDDVRHFCDALEIRDPIVLGVSFGGFVAQAYATRHPDHPKALILCNTSPRNREDRVLAAFERLGGAEARAAAAAYLREPTAETMSRYASVCLPHYNRTPQDPNLMVRAMPQANFELSMQFFRDEFRRFDFLDALAQVRCPTLVLAGEDDAITPLEDSEDIVAALPAGLAHLERFAHCGHPVYQDDPQRFFRVFREFVGSLADP